MSRASVYEYSRREKTYQGLERGHGVYHDEPSSRETPLCQSKQPIRFGIIRLGLLVEQSPETHDSVNQAELLRREDLAPGDIIAQLPMQDDVKVPSSDWRPIP
jgi:hypothetical protein